MAQHMLTKWEPDPFWTAVHQDILRDRLYTQIKDTQQVMFDYIAFGMAATPADPAVLDADRAALAAFPEAPKHHLNPVQGPFEWDPFPTQINQLLDVLELLLGIEIPHFNEQALNPFPVAERCVSGFRWQSAPYKVCGGNDPSLEYPGEDYLIAYWLGRYHGFLSADD